MIGLADLLAWHRHPAEPVREPLPPGAVDLIAESKDAIDRAADARVPVEAYDRRPAKALRVTDCWPDPYGPDVTVFGPAPHRGALWRASEA